MHSNALSLQVQILCLCPNTSIGHECKELGVSPIQPASQYLQPNGINVYTVCVHVYGTGHHMDLCLQGSNVFVPVWWAPVAKLIMQILFIFYCFLMIFRYFIRHVVWIFLLAGVVCFFAGGTCVSILYCASIRMNTIHKSQSDRPYTWSHNGSFGVFTARAVVVILGFEFLHLCLFRQSGFRTATFQFFLSSSLATWRFAALTRRRLPWRARKLAGIWLGLPISAFNWDIHGMANWIRFKDANWKLLVFCSKL